MTAPPARHLLIAGLAALLIPASARAEEPPENKGVHDFSFVAVPIPVSNPAIGTGLAVAALGLYKVGDSQRPWTTGVGGFYAQGGSWAGAVFQKAYIDEDKFRVLGGAGVADVKVDFFGIGQVANRRGRAIPIEEKGKGGVVQGLMRIAPHLYGGVQYRLISTDTTLNFEQLPFPDLAIPEVELKSKSSLLGIAGEFDTRDSEFGPTRGWYATTTILRGATGLGGDFNYTRAELAVNHYQPLGKAGVLALRASFCRSGDGAPYYDLCAFGSQNDLRGYTSGQYLDHAMYAVQAEYRRHLFWRLGGVVFAGVGSTAESFGKMSTGHLLPAAGLGLRLQASKEYGVNARIDYAWGKDSQAVYFSVGEAFSMREAAGSLPPPHQAG